MKAMPIARGIRHFLWTLQDAFKRKVVCGLGRLVGVALEEQAMDYREGQLHRTSRRHIDLVHFIESKEVAPDLALLDVGCGPGWLVERLSVIGFTNIAGCDWMPEEKLVPAARSLFTYSQVDLNGDGLRLYADDSYAVIVCSDVLEHLENPARMLRELARVLAPGGHLFITLPNAFNIFQRLHILKTGNSSRYKSERRTAPYSHISMVPYDVLESLCDRADLEIVEKGKGYCWWKNHFWFPERRVSHLFSYVAMYVLHAA